MDKNTYVSHLRPERECTCDIPENTPESDFCSQCGIWLDCNCRALPEAHRLAETTTVSETTTTTVTIQVTEETETSESVSTNQGCVKTEITTVLFFAFQRNADCD